MDALPSGSEVKWDFLCSGVQFFGVDGLGLRAFRLGLQQDFNRAWKVFQRVLQRSILNVGLSPAVGWKHIFVIV